MMDTYKKCPLCGTEARYFQGGFVACSNRLCIFYGMSVLVKDWQKRPLEEAAHQAGQSTGRAKHYREAVEVCRQEIRDTDYPPEVRLGMKFSAEAIMRELAAIDKEEDDE